MPGPFDFAPTGDYGGASYAPSAGYTPGSFAPRPQYGMARGPDNISELYRAFYGPAGAAMGGNPNTEMGGRGWYGSNNAYEGPYTSPAGFARGRSLGEEYYTPPQPGYGRSASPISAALAGGAR